MIGSSLKENGIQNKERIAIQQLVIKPKWCCLGSGVCVCSKKSVQVSGTKVV